MNSIKTAVLSITLVAVITTSVQSEAPSTPSFKVIEMLPGVVEPTRRVTLSAPFDGVLMDLDTNEGQTVELGASVAVMDNRVATASVRVAEQQANDHSSLQLAQTELEAAQQYARRVAAAHRKEAASEVELDNATFAELRAERRLKQVNQQLLNSQATLDLERARLEEHFVRSPFKGQVIRVDAKPGETLLRGDPIMSLANFDRLSVELQVPLTWFRRLKIGQTCWLSAGAPVNKEIAARVTTIARTVDPATRTFRCRLEIDNASHELPSGFTVQLITPSQLDIARRN